jgi:hypothetical protein
MPFGRFLDRSGGLSADGGRDGVRLSAKKSAQEWASYRSIAFMACGA